MPAPSPAQHRNTAARWWCLGWCAAALLHVTQAIWLSGFAAYPGDLGDARFNHCVLEHGWQSLRGAYAWLTPAIFYPVTQTLGLSDTHAGTLVFYAVPRALGADPGHAFLVWFIAVAALGPWSMRRLLDALEVDPWIAGPCVFLGCASMVTVFQTGSHAQLLPVFPSLFALDQWVRFARDGRRARVLSAVGWSLWQFGAAPYLALFLAALGVPAGVLLLHAGWRRRVGPETATFARAWTHAVVLILGGCFFVAATWAHFASVGRGFAPQIAELRDGAPTLRSWLTAPFPHPLLGGMFTKIGDARPVEPMFPGLVPWLAALGAVVAALVYRRESWGRQVLTLALIPAFALLLFTAPRAGGDSLFSWCATHLEFLRAFRATSRATVLVMPALAALGALGATAWIQSRAGERTRWHVAVVALFVLGALETLTLGQPAASLEAARVRRDAVAEVWRQSGDRPVLAFAPGYSNQPPHWVQLDAWAAALKLKRQTLNGYSASGPSSHIPFCFSTSAATARALMAQLGIDPDSVSIVSSWEPGRAAQLGIVQYDSRPVRHLTGWGLQPHRWSLFGQLEAHVVDGRQVYQFTPPAELRFHLPDEATAISLIVGMRPGSYDGGGHSDGVSIHWSMLGSDGTESVLWEEHIDPGRRPEHRGLLPVRFALKPGSNRELILRVGLGPAGDGQWDWPVFAELTVQ